MRKEEIRIGGEVGGSGVIMYWTFMPPPNTYVETLPLNVMVLGGE